MKTLPSRHRADAYGLEFVRGGATDDRLLLLGAVNPVRPQEAYGRAERGRPCGRRWAPGRGATIPSSVLQPIPPLEDEVQAHTNHRHQQDRERIPEPPPQLRHVLEVHAVNGSHQCRSKQDRRPRRDLLEVVVLVGLTCDDEGDWASDLCKDFFQRLSGWCGVTQLILPRRPPRPTKLPRFSPGACSETVGCDSTSGLVRGTVSNTTCDARVLMRPLVRAVPGRWKSAGTWQSASDRDFACVGTTLKRELVLYLAVNLSEVDLVPGGREPVP